jgi:acid phosphatase
MSRRLTILLLSLGAAALSAAPLPPIGAVFVMMFENNNWSEIIGNTNAPYINSLLPLSSYCQQYYTPPGIHPSEPNYLWLEAGTNFGIADDNPPVINSQNTGQHLVTLLKNAGISWKTYQEGIPGDTLPLWPVEADNFDPKHCPFLFFDDVTGTNNPYDAYGLAHVRPFSELAGDLAGNTVARYNLITPDLCDDGHNCPLSQTDWWLSQQLPLILASKAYSNNGAVFICWDEGNNDSDGPVGMIVLSPLARGGGYHNNIHYDHGSTLRTFG